MTAFVPFPRTPHLVLPDGADVRDDKVLPVADAVAFLAEPVVVEEKVDGENLGLSVVDAAVVAQSRGSYVDLGGPTFRGLESWLAPRRHRLERELGTDLVMFGEWCRSQHSVAYDALPDWWLVFDVFDRGSQSFWTLDERDLLADALGLATVPRLGEGRFDLDRLTELVGLRSSVGHSTREGVVLRDVADPSRRAKLVRRSFIDGIDTHWRSVPARANRLASLSPG